MQVSQFEVPMVKMNVCFRMLLLNYFLKHLIFLQLNNQETIMRSLKKDDNQVISMIKNVYENYILYGNLKEVILNTNDGYCKRRSPNFDHYLSYKTTKVIQLLTTGSQGRKIYGLLSYFKLLSQNYITLGDPWGWLSSYILASCAYLSIKSSL